MVRMQPRTTFLIRDFIDLGYRSFNLENAFDLTTRELLYQVQSSFRNFATINIATGHYLFCFLKKHWQIPMIVMLEHDP